MYFFVSKIFLIFIFELFFAKNTQLLFIKGPTHLNDFSLSGVLAVEYNPIFL
jgi:hypothetical protein